MSKMGQIARKSLGLGTTRFPFDVQREITAVCCLPAKLLKDNSKSTATEVKSTISQARLIEAMRKIDPELAKVVEKALARE